MNAKRFQDSSAIQNTQCKTSDKFEEHGKALTVLFFSRLKTVYGRKYDMQFKNESEVRFARREWYSEIAKLTVESINNGFEKLKQKLLDESPDYNWPDVSKIIALCKPTAEELGLPSLDQTIAEIVKRYGRYRTEEFEYSHRLVELVASDCGYFVTRESSEKFERRARVSHTKWVKKAQESGLPAKIPALELKVEQTPVFENKTAVNPFQARIDALRQKAKDEHTASIKLTDEKIVSSRGAA